MNPEKDGWRPLLELLANRSKKELDELLWLFLTFEEKKDLADRYLIIRELLKGEKSQREMAQELKVSIAKITRGSNFLKTLTQSLRRRLKALLK